MLLFKKLLSPFMIFKKTNNKLNSLKKIVKTLKPCIFLCSSLHHWLIHLRNTLRYQKIQLPHLCKFKTKELSIQGECKLWIQMQRWHLILIYRWHLQEQIAYFCLGLRLHYRNESMLVWLQGLILLQKKIEVNIFRINQRY